MKTLLIGIGSPYGDDRLGWQVLEFFHRQYPESPGLNYHCSDRHNLDWFGQTKSARRVIFVDAVVSGVCPGSILHFHLDPTSAEADTIQESWKNPNSSHGIATLDAIRIAQKLGELGDQVEFFGLEIDTQNLSTELSPEVKKQLPKLLADIAATLDLPNIDFSNLGLPNSGLPNLLPA